MEVEPATPDPAAQHAVRRLLLPRETRMVSKGDFERAWKQGSRARGDVLLVIASPNSAGCARLGLSIGKKVWKDAVGRNRVRRVFREAFRMTRQDLPAGFDYILVAAAPKLKPTLGPTSRELARLGPKAVARFEKKRDETPGPQ